MSTHVRNMSGLGCGGNWSYEQVGFYDIFVVAMCGRYSFFNEEELFERFQVPKITLPLTDHYNVAPGTVMPVIVSREERQVVPMRWGLLPHWAQEEKVGYKMINARAETLSEKRSFKNLLAHNRCLIPASGFFEWEKQDGGPKQPYYIHLKHEPLFAFAGLYNEWKHPEAGTIIPTYTIITTDANEAMAAIHTRMPVILDRDYEDEWLNPDLSEPEHVMRQLQLIEPDEMDIYPVSTAVNTPKNDTASVLKPLED